MELVIGEDGLARERKEPYAIFECPTKEDADKLNEMIEFYNKHHYYKESKILKSDYSEDFDVKRKASIEQSYYKYGKASKNFATGNVDAIGSLEKCLEKFKETKNTEYLIDVANYAMFRYMWPQDGEYFKRTSSDESAGIVGMSVKEMEDFKNGNS